MGNYCKDYKEIKVLEVKKLSVRADKHLILKDVDLSVGEKDIIVLFGPNGSGKSTLVKAILGLSGFQVLKGDILFDGKSIKQLSVSDRVGLGIGIMFQHPPKIHGVKLLQIAEYLEKDKTRIKELARELRVEDFLGRDVNLDLSGGEIKRAELFQILLQKPKLLMIDEPESGVDIENISVMGNALNRYLQLSGCGCLVITHTGYILEYVKAKKGCAMLDGSICCYEEPEKIFRTIQRYGYERCKNCECEAEE